jgi:hypothetical protein
VFEYVNQNIIKISEKPDSQSAETPKLFKTNSCSWANGTLDDEFINEIAYLVKNSTIKS